MEVLMARSVSSLCLILAAGLSLVPLSAQAPQPSLDDELLALLNTPVQGASKREQRLIDSPQAIELITGDELRQMGIYRLQDALKLMTSIDLLEADNGYSVVGLRGVMQEGQPRTIQVLIDGVPQYSSIGATIDISNLPVPIDLIDKIEVVRGPSSTLYGANSVTGVIAITTRHPGKGLTGSARVSRGDKSTTRGSLSLLLGDGQWGVSAGYQGYSMGASGFETHYLGRPTDLRSYRDLPPSPNVSDNPWVGSDAGHGSQAMARGQYTARDTSVWVSAGRSDKWYGPEGYFNYRTAARTSMLAGWRQTWTEGFSTELRIHQFKSENHLSSSTYLTAAFEDPGFLSDYNWAEVKTTQAELQANWTLAQDFFLVFGADTRKIETGRTRFIGLANGAEETASGGFAALDWKALPTFSVSLGLRAENESLGGSRTSPRLVLVWNPTPSSAVRAGYYTSTRSPQIMEQRVDVSLFSGMFYPTLDNPLPPNIPVYSQLLPNAALKPEKTTNLELGYRQAFGPLTVDLTVYQMKFTELISQVALAPAVQPGVTIPPLPPPFAGTSYAARLNLPKIFQNAGDATNTGAELAVSWVIQRGWTAGANMTLLSFTKDQRPTYDSTQHPFVSTDEFAYTVKNKGNLWLRVQEGKFTGFLAVQAVGETMAEALSVSAAPSFEPRDRFIQWHATAAYEVWQGLSLGAYVRNGAKEFTLQGATSPERLTPYQAMRREFGGTVSYRF